MKLPDYTALGNSGAGSPSTSIAPATMRPLQPAEAGAGMIQMGNAEQNFAADIVKEQERQDTLRVEDAWNKLRSKQDDLTYGQQGFVNLKGGDAVNAPLLKTYGDQLAQTTAAIGGTLDNQNQRTLFAQRAGISSLQMKEDILKHVNSQKAVYEEDTLKGTIAVERQNASRNYLDPQGSLLPLERIDQGIDSYARNNGKPAEWVSEAKTEARDGVYGDMIKAQLVEDPQGAHASLLTYWGQLSGKERAALDSTVTTHEYMAAMRDQAVKAREDALAIKVKGQEQNQNWGGLLARVYDPNNQNPVTAHEISLALTAQEITPQMAEATMSAIKGGSENILDKIGAIQMAHDDSLTIAEKNSALARMVVDKKINAETAGMVQNAIYAIDTRGEGAVQRGMFESMSSIMGGHNVDMGLIHLDNAQERKQAELWGQARSEWTQRVVVGKEDPLTVRNNILQRYMQDVEVPSWLSQPKYGAITSMADFERVKMRTQEMYVSGALTRNEAERQNDLLNDYRMFYQDQLDRRKRAQSALKPGSNKDDNATVKGISPGGNQ